MAAESSLQNCPDHHTRQTSYRIDIKARDVGYIFGLLYIHCDQKTQEKQAKAKLQLTFSSIAADIRKNALYTVDLQYKLKAVVHW